MTRYELFVLGFLFVYSDYYVADNHILWTAPHNFMYGNSNVFQDFSPTYYYAIHGKYRPTYSDYDVTNNLSPWTCNFIEWMSDEQFFHEFFYYAMFGKYRPFLFFNI